MFRLHVQLTPQIHEGSMRHYWSIDLHTEQGQFTVHHGWAEDATNAALDAVTCAGLNGITV